MTMLNKVILMGRLTKDPELRSTPSGVLVATFSLAVESDYKGPNGEKTTDFFDVIAWRKTAEFIHSYFGKGRMMVVEGRLRAETWEDNNTGKMRKNIKVVADSVYFGDSKREENTAPGATYQTPYSAPAPVPQNSFAQQGFTEVTGIEDDDFPF